MPGGAPPARGGCVLMRKRDSRSGAIEAAWTLAQLGLRRGSPETQPANEQRFHQHLRIGVAGGAALCFTDILQHQGDALALRSEEHTSELQSLMRISYDVFCLKKKTKQS